MGRRQRQGHGHFQEPGGRKQPSPSSQRLALAFSPDGTALAVGGGNQVAAEVHLWNVAAGKETLTLKSQGWPRGLAESVYAPRLFYSVVFSPDGKIIAAGGGDGPHGEVKLWDSATGKHLGDLPASSWQTTSVAFSNDGKVLASGAPLRVCILAPAGLATPGSNLSATVLKDDRDSVCVAFSPDGKTLASAGWSSRTVELWDVASGKRLAALRAHKSYVAYVAFLPDGKTLVSAGDYDDGSIRLWDVASGQNTATVMTDHMDLYGLALSPDGKTLASAALGQIKLWDVKTR